jgi:large conductance mechanosensitive channel
MRGAELWREFKGFALKGNIIDLAVAVIIGNAFGAVVNSLVKNIIMPLISYLSYVSPLQGGYQDWHLGQIKIGAFLGDLVNFLVISFAMFLIMKKLLEVLRRASISSSASEPTTKKCPLCLSEIPVKATKCAHCTADLAAQI